MGPRTCVGRIWHAPSRPARARGRCAHIPSRCLPPASSAGLHSPPTRGRRLLRALRRAACGVCAADVRPHRHPIVMFSHENVPLNLESRYTTHLRSPPPSIYIVPLLSSFTADLRARPFGLTRAICRQPSPMLSVSSVPISLPCSSLTWSM